MNSALMSTFDSSGADETLIADFRAVADTNRYPRDTVQVWIAKFVVGTILVSVLWFEKLTQFFACAP